jgi:uncharacterized damage-inducible protein DinB
MQPDQASFMLQLMLANISNEHKVTKKVIAALPPDQLAYTPDPASMAAFAIARHLAASEMMFMDGVVNGEFPSVKIPESVVDTAGLIAWYDEQFYAYREKLSALSGEQCAKVLDFHGMFTSPAVQFLMMMTQHSCHHRGQLSAYLRPMGAKVPSIYGPSGDEKIMPATQQATA